MNPLERLRARLTEITNELRGIDETAGDAPLDEEQQTRFDALLTERETVQASIATEERRETVRRSLTVETPAVVVRDSDASPIGPDGRLTAETRALPHRRRTTVLMDTLLRANEHRITNSDNQAHFEHVMRSIARNPRCHDWVASIVQRSTDAYEDAFRAMLSGTPVAMLPDELRTALSTITSANGAYLLPTHLDPTIILSNTGTSNVMRQYATIKQLPAGYKTWTGITSAGVTASWDTELSEVSDDSPTFDDESISTFQGRAFCQASIQALEDIVGLEDDLMMLFADARDRLEGAAHMTGAGSTSAPLGLFTAINASSSLQTTSTTAATIGEVDIHALYRALPVRWRRNGSWVMNPLYSTAIKRLGTAVSSAYSGDLTAPVSSRILDKPVVETDDAPTTQTTTALDQEIVFADLSQFFIVDKVGSGGVEFIPHLFNTANNLPDGRRGWLFHWRGGSGMPNLAAGRILVDKTSA